MTLEEQIRDLVFKNAGYGTTVNQVNLIIKDIEDMINFDWTAIQVVEENKPKVHA